MNVNEAIAAVKANPSDYESPLPWRADDTFVFAADGTAAAHWVKHSRAAHIAAAVNAAPVLIAEVERLQKLLSTSEHLRQLEAQAVAQAIRAPDGPLRMPSNLTNALRGVTLPEDFLPAVERICAENDRLQAQLAAARVAVESAALPPLPLGSHYLAFVERANDIGQAQRKALAAVRRALGLEVGK